MPLTLTSLFRFTLLMAGLALAALSASAQIAGQVVEKDTGDPVFGANIKVVGTDQGTSSLENGNFELNWKRFPVRLQITAIGYKEKTLILRGNGDTLIVELRKSSYRAQEIVVSSGRIKSFFASSSPFKVTRLNQENLKTKITTNAVDLLKSEPGVFIQQTTPGQGSVYIRGRAGRDVLYLFNGLRFNPAFVRSGQNQYFGAIDPFGIEEMEVFRGSISVYHGSDALSGGIDVIPVIKPFSEEIKTEGHLLGQFNIQGTGEQTMNLNFSQQESNYSFYFNGTARDFNFYNMSPNTNSDLWFPYGRRLDNADYQFYSYTATGRFRLTDRSQLEAVSYYSIIPTGPRFDRMLLDFDATNTSIADADKEPRNAFFSNTAPLVLSAHSLSYKLALNSTFVSNLTIRGALEAVIRKFNGDKTTEDWKNLMLYTKRVWFSSGIHHHYSRDRIARPLYFMD